MFPETWQKDKGAKETRVLARPWSGWGPRRQRADLLQSKISEAMPFCVVIVEVQITAAENTEEGKARTLTGHSCGQGK